VRSGSVNKRHVCVSWLYSISDSDVCTAQQTETSEKRRAERAEAFVAPVERAAATVEEKRKRKLREVEREMDNKDERKKKRGKG
jgi:hypothetical protein